MIWYCTHCGKERPEQPGYKRIDDRYTIVVCRTGRETDDDDQPLTSIPPKRLALDKHGAPLGKLRQGVPDVIKAGQIVKERRAAARRRAVRRVLWSETPKGKKTKVPV
jgi:hypothetical protein